MISKNTKKIAIARDELTILNEKFLNKSLLPSSFYKQLMQKGFAYRKCILVSVFPDSSNTYFGRIIRQDGVIYEFDIDLDSPNYSLWKDITDSFKKKYLFLGKSKPWLAEVIALDLFSESMGS